MVNSIKKYSERNHSCQTPDDQPFFVVPKYWYFQPFNNEQANRKGNDRSSKNEFMRWVGLQFTKTIRMNRTEKLHKEVYDRKTDSRENHKYHSFFHKRKNSDVNESYAE